MNNHKESSESVNAFGFLPKDDSSQAILRKRAEIFSQSPKAREDTNIFCNYVKFRLGNEFYGINYKAIGEVMEQENLTPLPFVSTYIAGLVNRRGALLTILDLKMFLQGQPTQRSSKSNIIVININGIHIGILAEEIEGSHAYDPEQLHSPIPSENLIKLDYILGIDAGTTAILNIDTIMTDLQQQLVAIQNQD